MPLHDTLLPRRGLRALVTAGASGIGATIARALAEAGARVHVCDIDSVALARGIPGAAGITASVADASVASDVDRVFADVEASLGGLDVLVNNAGITRDMTFKKMDKVNWDAVLRTNLDSLFNMTKQVADGMVERGWGRVINISSVNGIKGQFGQANYSAAKAGILGFTKAIAQEVARKGVTVNAIAPGYVGTDMVMAIKPEVREQIVAQIPMGRLGKPEEIGKLVAFLASEYAGYMTGSTLSINGGLHMS